MLPSTLKGPGWRPRSSPLRVTLPTLTRPRGYSVNNEVEALKAVLLTWPGDELSFEGSPADVLMRERPNLQKMRQEATNIADYYAQHGATVHWIRPQEPAPPNLVFACDLATMTPTGAILSRMAAEQRAGEERFAAEALIAAGVPVLAIPGDDATLEGADVMWLRPNLVLVGTGVRTNAAGAQLVRSTLAKQGVDVAEVPISPRVQHLLGSVNLLDHHTCAAYAPTPELTALLEVNGYKILPFEAEPEVTDGRALNFVTIGPRHIVMPAGCPRVRSELQNQGIRCDELGVDEYIRAEGALGCLTGILGRDPARFAAE